MPKEVVIESKETTEKTVRLKKDNKVTKNKVSKKIPKKMTKKSIKDKELPKEVLEYYDLPYRYNETVVKILAQTPKRLFVYWEVSEKDRETYINAFGEDFFEKTYPVLLVHNEEWNYTFEVPINDFANSWYLDIKDPKSKYVVKLGRKFRDISDIKPKEEVIKEEHINLQNDFIYITDSNKLETPNDHVLFEKLPNQIIYRNVKNGNETKRDSTDVLDKFTRNYREVDIRYVYHTLYGDEEYEEEIMLNPSSGGLSSSIGKSSRLSHWRKYYASKMMAYGNH